jgi:hypothetical protein
MPVGACRLVFGTNEEKWGHGECGPLLPRSVWSILDTFGNFAWGGAVVSWVDSGDPFSHRDRPAPGRASTPRLGPSRAHRTQFKTLAVTQLILKRASASRLSGEWSDDDFDALADGVVVGRIMEAAASPVGLPWMWTILVIEHREDFPATPGYEATREAAMAAFAKSWRRET